MERGWIDVSSALRPGMVVYPGDPPVVLGREKDMAKGDRVTVSVISLGLHAGTHVDAPSHLFPDGPSIEAVHPDRLVGTALVVAVEDPKSIDVSEIGRSPVEAGRIILFRTRNSSLWRSDRFFSDYVYLSAAAATYLVEKGAAAVGVDYLSVDPFGDGLDAHRVLLSASVPIIEGLDLSAVAPGLYECVCLPLLIPGAEAAPARVLLRATAAAAPSP